MMDYIQNCFPGWNVHRTICKTNSGTLYEMIRELPDKTEVAALTEISTVYSDKDIQALKENGYSDQAISDHYHAQLQELAKGYSLMLNMKDQRNILYCDDLKYVRHADNFGWTLFVKTERFLPAPQLLSGDYNEKTVLTVGMDICRALVQCQKHGIIHRDIRPQHILMSDDGSYKLSAFNNAATDNQPAPPPRLASFDYIAPELYQGLPCSAKTDLYSLGLVMYSMMNHHRLPFLPLTENAPSEEDFSSAFQSRISGTPIPPPAQGCEELKSIVAKACAHDPDDRYASPQEMYDALNRCLQRTASVDATMWVSPPAPENPSASASGIPENLKHKESDFEKPHCSVPRFLLPLLIGGGSVFLTAITAAVLLLIGSIHNNSKTYTVQFVDWNGDVLHVAEYAKGDTIQEPAAPKRDSDNAHHYTFTGWDNPVGTCEGEMTFVATYSSTQKRAGWIAEGQALYYYNDDKRVAREWVKDEQGLWVYLKYDGSVLKNGWAKDSSGWHYMDDSGHVVTNCWVLDGEQWVYLKDSGDMARKEWVTDKTGQRCYVDEDGYLVRDQWIQPDGATWYRLDENGYLLTNCWVQDSIDWVYLNENGTITTNAWIQDSIGWCYVDENGYIVRNKKIPDGDTWYDIGPDGYIQK